MRITPIGRQLAIVFLVLFAIYCLIPIQEHQTFHTLGYDVGIFEQAIRDWSHFRIPVIPIIGDARFGTNHFNPVIALVGPFYAFFPSIYTIFVAQAFLLALGSLPLVRFAREAKGAGFSWFVAASYGLCPAIAGAVRGGFHEIAFAVPLLAFSLTSYLKWDYRSAVLWALPLVLVKEDLGLTVAALGVLLAWKGARRLGAIAAAWGVIWTYASVVWLIPKLSGTGTYLYTSMVKPKSMGDYVSTVLQGADEKTLTFFLLIAPVGFICLRSPILLLTLPTLGWRFTSDNYFHWSMGNQYDAVLVPIVIAAMIDGVGRIRRPKVRELSLAAGGLFTVSLIPIFAFGMIGQPGFWGQTPRTQSAHRLLNEIPDNVKVAASIDLSPHLTGRTTTYEAATPSKPSRGFVPNDWKSANWLILDTSAESPMRERYRSALAERLSHGFVIVDQADGIVVARRDSTQ